MAAKGYRGGFNPNRDTDGCYTTPAGVGRPSKDPRRSTQQLYRSRDGRQAITQDARGYAVLKRDGKLAGASVYPKRGGGGYTFKRPNGRTTYSSDYPTQAAAVNALKRYARGK